MKQLSKLLILIFLLGGWVQGFAQPSVYGNEWIDYSRTYYKFKVGKEGIYRITKPALDAAGIPATVNGAQFILYREGQEVPLYITTNSVFGSNDYIEFFGTKADGNLDKEVFPDPNWQSNARISLFTDTAVYFLSWNTQTPHLRYTLTPNNIPGSPPAPLSYCLVTAGNDYTSQFSMGKNNSGGQIFPSAIFDNAEGYVKEINGSGTASAISLATPNNTAGANAILKTSALRVTYWPAPLNFKIYLNNQLIADSNIAQDETKHFNLSVPPGSLTANNNIEFVPTTTATTLDHYGISFLEIRYPRNFDLSGLDYFSAALPASASSQYIEFLNFNQGGNPPRLYDLTNKRYYAGDISVAGKTRFYLNASLTERNIVLYATNTSKISNLNSVKTTQFTDYSLSQNNGDFVIISHKNLNVNTNGHHYIDDYKAYRSSAGGGNHSVVVAYVDDLYDQFGYGAEMHPLSIKRFLQYLYYKGVTKPQYTLLIGKGLVYYKYRAYLQNPTAYNFSIVPTWGDPGADVDFVNFLPNRHQAITISRLSAYIPQEAGNYLDKLKGYEIAAASGMQPTYETSYWKKRVLHIVGGKDIGEQTSLLVTMNLGKSIISDSLVGADVTTITKNTTTPIDPVNSKSIDSLINGGLLMIGFHGHATPNGFDYNLNHPDQYHNAPKIPLFLAMGCDVAQMFYLTNSKTISEKYIDVPDGGSINMIAANNLGFPPFHAIYTADFYTSIATRNYNTTTGTHHHFTYDSILTTTQAGNLDFNFTHLESMLMQGDPAVRFFPLDKPDYHIYAGGLSSIPSNVTTSLDSFKMKIVSYNLGKAIKDTVHVKVEHTHPANNTTLVTSFSVVNLFNADTVIVKVPIDKIADLGLNKFRVTIDHDSRFDEMNETNNSATLELFIYSDNLIPVYPYEFSIVHQQGVTLKASTLNPFRAMGRYKMEIDTTELFNSPFKQQTTISSPGGVIKWKPGITLMDSVVYYWRTAFDSIEHGNYIWTSSSFIYLASGSDGWNQSHYFQYEKNSFENLNLTPSRAFQFPIINNTLTVSNAVYSDIGTTPWTTADFMKVMLNGTDKQRLGCPGPPPYFGGTFQIMVFDSVTNAPWENDVNGTSGAYPVCLGTRNKYSFEFPIFTEQGRADAKHFLDSIPNGHYIVVRNIINDAIYFPTFAADLKNASDPSLYYTLRDDLGFTDIDSFDKKRVFIFVRKKGNNNFPVYQFFSQGSQDRIEEKDIIIQALTDSGKMNSVIIGPATEWKQLKWKYSSPDGLAQNDIPVVRVTGIDINEQETNLYEGNNQDMSLSFINASLYPSIRMEWVSRDTITRSSPQLSYWRVLYDPVPEAALNPAAHYIFNDSLNIGQSGDFSVAIENLTDIDMDSMLVRYKITNEAGISTTIASKRYARLDANDTIHASISFDPAGFTGNNVFFIEANPEKDQPEQYHPNNLGYIPFKVITDQRNPLLDVTFDGVHILDNDIVSSKPFIKVLLHDENLYLALDDTSLLDLSLRHPDQISSSTKIHFDGTICKFIPATPGGKNDAVIEFKPELLQDGTYQLQVNGKDKSGNQSAQSSYKVAFEVINQPSITNILNYPNPFSTATAFVFTLTGSQIPSQFKIQIMTVTGKVVREITKHELGPLHIGRNITEYKWDGKDQYGQILGNGVYLYRVVTSLNGNAMDHRQSGADKFYKNGYGKMYIMR